MKHQKMYTTPKQRKIQHFFKFYTTSKQRKIQYFLRCYKCNECGEILNDNIELLHQWKTHLPPIAYKFEYQNELFNHVDELHRHVRIL